MYTVMIREVLYYGGYKQQSGRMVPIWHTKGTDFELCIFSKREDAELEAKNYPGAHVVEVLLRAPVKRMDTK